MTNLRLCDRGLMSGDRTPLELLLLLLGMSACSASTSGVLLSLLSSCGRDRVSDDGVAGECSGVSAAARCSRSCDEYCDCRSRQHPLSFAHSRYYSAKLTVPL